MFILEMRHAMRTKFDSYHWVDTSAGGLFVPEGIIRPVVTVSALTWFIRYICYWVKCIVPK